MTGGRNSLYCLKTTFFLLILYRLLYVVISWFVFQMFPLFKISSSLKSAKTSGFLPTLPRKKTSYVKTPGVPSWRNASGYTNSLGEKTAGYTGRPLGHSHGNLGTCYVIQEIYGHIQYYLVGGFKHFLFSIIYGMSSFPLTNSYFWRWLVHHQPVNYCLSSQESIV
jgi:hypothetical protein